MCSKKKLKKKENATRSSDLVLSTHLSSPSDSLLQFIGKGGIARGFSFDHGRTGLTGPRGRRRVRDARGRRRTSVTFLRDLLGVPNVTLVQASLGDLKPGYQKVKLKNHNQTLDFWGRLEIPYGTKNESLRP